MAITKNNPYLASLNNVAELNKDIIKAGEKVTWTIPKDAYKQICKSLGRQVKTHKGVIIKTFN